MNFRTEVTPLKYRGAVTHSTPVLMLGSCFAENIGLQLANRLFDVTVNPFGTLYNPESVRGAVVRLCHPEPYTAEDLFQDPANGVWHSFDHHSRFSGKDRTEVLQKINGALMAGHETVKSAGVIFITYGTTTVWIEQATGKTVANCHKLPATAFKTLELGYEVAKESVLATIDTIRGVNRTALIVLTVSPVKYFPDDIHRNTLIKSTLQLAVKNAVDKREGVIYFPAYEALCDDLRDYRFYADDLRHPSTKAIEYIFELFERSFLDHKTVELSRKCLDFTRIAAHRPLIDRDASSEATANAAGILLKQFPGLENRIKRHIEKLN